MLTEKTKILLRDIDVELSQINQSDFSLRKKVLLLKRILEQCCKEITTEEALQFPSLFSRIVFISQKYNLPQSLERSLHQIRVLGTFLLKDENNTATQYQFEYTQHSLSDFLKYLFDGVYDRDEAIKDIYKSEPLRLDKIRVQVIDIDRENYLLTCQPKDITEDILSVRCNVDKLNNVFNDTFDGLWVGAQLNLIDCTIDKLGYYIPSMLVLEPDYMIDASAMAECFQSYGSSHLHYFRRKFEPVANSHYLLLGNLSNFFLDELIYAEDAAALDFDEVFLRSFKNMPFEFTACQDIQNPIAFRDFMQRAKRQFENIRRVVMFDMTENGFSLDRCVLEPSFFSEKYGFQGRLDMLQIDAADGFSRIVELKSGKTPFPQDDFAKIAPNHETQTSVYRLMVQSVFGKKAREIHAMILYSSADFKGQNLRLSAPYKQQEKEIVNARNLIVATEYNLYTGNAESVKRIFEELLNTDNYAGRVPGFFSEKLLDIKKVLQACSSLELEYFSRYISFVSRELYLLKMGDEGYDSSMSLSALWNTSFQERKEALELVSDLEIVQIDESLRDMQITFKRSASSNFVNLREGEICILYPRQSDRDTILSNQILKGTVIQITENNILVRFRYKQRNRAYFDNNKYWVIEHDKLDHSYNGMFKSLFSFLQAPKRKRNILLGLDEPKVAKPIVLTDNSKEGQQQYILDKALVAEDYFLIVGPPGTGKTSIFARQLIERFYAQPNTNILVMAYTNRAVDELCAAICSAFKEEDCTCESYIRIGSEYSCGEMYRHRLLQNVSEKSKNRKELLETLQGARIYVGTLASIVAKPELFEIKKFDVAIIDEASQILEPQIIGLLPLVDKFIMIGDHKQLSTITLQNEYKSHVDNEALNTIGLYDCRESIFERLYRTAQVRGWVWAYDTLAYHGRMHEDIACLVNQSFYDGILLPATERQVLPLRYDKPDTDTVLGKLVSSTRVSFIPVCDTQHISGKINQLEAESVVTIASTLIELYRTNQKEFDSQKTLGIIAPYRNQIALIKHLLIKTGIIELQSIMVDTVERYQGSQRDVIIVSFCFNSSSQMRYFANMNREGTVDRKLNVALTRAREQLFLVGNRSILEQNKLYRELISSL